MINNSKCDIICRCYYLNHQYLVTYADIDNISNLNNAVVLLSEVLYYENNCLILCTIPNKYACAINPIDKICIHLTPEDSRSIIDECDKLIKYNIETERFQKDILPMFKNVVIDWEKLGFSLEEREELEARELEADNLE